MFKKTTLKNGLRILTIPQKHFDTVAVLVLVATGSKYEKKSENGISHFIEHMLFKGTKKRLTPLDINREIDRVGGTFNAFTSKEITGFYTYLGSSHLDLALDVLSDTMLNSKLDDAEIEKEKGVILEELKMIQDTPMRYIDDLWEELLYGNQPAGWPLIGTEKSIKSFNRQRILKYIMDQYVARNVLICVAGNFNQKSIVPKIEKYFKNLGIGKSRPIAPLRERQRTPSLLLFTKKTDQTHLVLGSRAYNIFDPRRYILSTLAVILGGNKSSRLFIEIREKRGLAYYIHTSPEYYKNSGYFSTSAGLDNQRIEEGIRVILSEYKKIAREGPSGEEMKLAKEFLKGRLKLSLDTPPEQASFFSGQEILTRKILTLQEIYRMIEKVTVNDIKRVARDIFRPEKLNLALIGPFEDKKRFKKLLKI